MKISLFFLNLAALAGTFFPSANAPAAVPESKDAAAGLVAANLASLKSIESSWLELPRTCKAKGFHAEAESVERTPVSPAVAAIYGIRSA